MQTVESAADTLHHLQQIITQIWNGYVTARLSNEIIVPNEIIGPVRSGAIFLLVDKEREPV